MYVRGSFSECYSEFFAKHRLVAKISDNFDVICTFHNYFDSSEGNVKHEHGKITFP